MWAQAARGTSWEDRDFLLTDIANSMRGLVVLTRDQWAKHPGPRPEFIDPPKTKQALEQEALELEAQQQAAAAIAPIRAKWFSNN